MLEICEIFRSIQGESTFAGRVCAFVRLSGCNLACSYCDTRYAREAGRPMEVDEAAARVTELGCALAEVTGGEPLLQEETPELCRALLAGGLTVLVETNGTCDISVLPADAIRVMDVKCPSSGMADRFCASNVDALTERDECKFVVGDRGDFDWACEFVRAHGLSGRCTLIVSPVWGRVAPAELAEWVLSQKLPLRYGLQLHKVLWGESRRR
jgi:7-carboxy-7-deazaguanine synthase